MKGERLRRALAYLADHFDDAAMPKKGRYVPEPAVTDQNGVVTVPPAPFDPVPVLAAGAAIAIGAAMVYRNRSVSET
jgi:hypothetical protein